MTTTNYSNCTVYQLRCKDKTIEQVYIGATNGSINARMIGHRFYANHTDDPKYRKMAKLYDFINANGGIDNWVIEALQEGIYCEDHQAMEKIEAQWREELPADILLNTLKTVGRTGKEKEEYLRELVQCEQCSKKLLRSNMGRHVTTQHTKKDRPCDITNRARLAVLVKCPECDKEMRQGSLKSHIRGQHTEGKDKVTCPECQKVIGKYYLPSHMKQFH